MNLSRNGQLLKGLLTGRCPIRQISSTFVWRHGTVEKVSFSELPELVKGTVKDTVEDDSNDVPPALQEIRNIMRKYPDKVVLTELGKFYELYFENAEEFGPKLNLRVTKKKYAKSTVSMAGFPSYTCFKYIGQIVNNHETGVVLVRQYLKKGTENENTNVRKVYRKIFRVITPGTIVDEDMLDNEKNNFLLSIGVSSLNSKKIALSWCDISTTEVYSQEIEVRDILTHIHRIKPTEILIPKKFYRKFNDLLELNNWTKKQLLINWREDNTSNLKLKNFYNMFNERDHGFLDKYFETFTPLEAFSICQLLQYSKEQFDVDNELDKTIADTDNDLNDGEIPIDELDSNSFNFSLPLKIESGNYMLIDSSAREALEITETIKTKSSVNTLFNTIKRTVTPSGGRTLRNWLDSPPFNLKESKRRLSIMEWFLKPKNKILIFRLNNQLSRIKNHDGLRLLFAISFKSTLDVSGSMYSGTSNIKVGWNYLALLRLLQNYSLIKEEIEAAAKICGANKHVTTLLNDIKIPTTLMKNLDKYINQENLENMYQMLSANDNFDNENEEIMETEKRDIPNTLKSENNKKASFPDMTWIIKVSNLDEEADNKALLASHESLRKLLQDKAKLEADYGVICEKLGIKNLELRIENDFPSIYIQFPSKNNITNKILAEEFDMVNSMRYSKTSRVFLTSKWSKLGFNILKQIKQIKQQELEVIYRLRLDVLRHFKEIKECVKMIDTVDILMSFAKLSKELNLTKPKLSSKVELDIINGRHLMVESNLQQSVAVEFQANDCKLSDKDKIGYVISGPNMGGKSTYLRQNALIVIMAQIGCFVPADYAKIGLVDRIFTRIGSADDISNNTSTFMSEMNETSHSLTNATKNSLLIFDEIGRGTSNKEGIAIAFGILKFLVEDIGARFLFATHFAPEINKLIEATDSDLISSKVDYYCTHPIEKLLNAYLEMRKKDPSVNNIFSGRFFDHRIVKGLSEHSYATSIASLAGVPEKVIHDAERAIKLLK